MKLAHRFALLLAILITGFGVYGYWSFHTLNHLKVNGPVYQRIVQGKDLIADILPPPEYILESYLVTLQINTATPEERKPLVEALSALRKDYKERRDFWEKESLDATLKGTMDEADRSAQAFYAMAFDQWLPALEKNDSAAAETALAAMKSHYAAHRQAIDKVVKLATARNADDEAKAREEISTSTAVMLGILVVVIAIVSWMLGVLSRRLISQLGGEPDHAVALAQQVGSGDLGSPIALRVGDTHSLMAQLQQMQQSLLKVVNDVRQEAQGVALASAEIAQGNSDLATRTQEQASALEQTATAMGQLNATVNQNVDSAEQANQLALNASAVAIKGGEVVSQVVETMKGINEASHRISEIIGVIDSIAFQTNILALNAAVEAARAGEQGRGFAVVASEVRSLAGRSAQAAKEIKDLINTSVQRVSEGSMQVDAAGATMHEVVDSIKRVTDIMGEISAASREQSLGVSQISAAVSQMDQATQQNASLVEEMASAADKLNEQSQELVGTVSIFKLGDGATYSAPRPARRTPSTTPYALQLN